MLIRILYKYSQYLSSKQLLIYMTTLFYCVPKLQTYTYYVVYDTNTSYTILYIVYILHYIIVYIIYNVV